LVLTLFTTPRKIPEIVLGFFLIDFYEYCGSVNLDTLTKGDHIKNKIALLIATWFYSGLIPPVILKGMAGTYGSFFSIPLCYLLLITEQKIGLSYGFVTILIFLLGLWCVSKAEISLGPRTDWKNKTKSRDQNQIVIDETFGVLITCYPLTLINFNSYWLVLGIAFVLFRFFDIVKVPPTKYFDNMKNAFGVMFDDFVAGIYSAIMLTILVLVLKL